MAARGREPSRQLPASVGSVSKNSAVRLVRRCPEPSAMGFDDRALIASPMPCHWLGLVEGVEQAVDIDGIETRRNLAPDQHGMRIGRAGCRRSVCGLSAPRSRLDRIEDQIQDDLLELHSISGNGGRLRASGLQLNAIPLQLAWSVR